jgi:hypothetical protein
MKTLDQKGSFGHMARCVAHVRSIARADGSPAPTEQAVRSLPLDPAAGSRISAFAAAAICMKPPRLPTERQVRMHTVLKEGAPGSAGIRHLTIRFQSLMRHPDETKLDRWLDDAKDCRIPAVVNFARTSMIDIQAVGNAVIGRWGNGQGTRDWLRSFKGCIGHFPWRWSTPTRVPPPRRSPYGFQLTALRDRRSAAKAVAEIAQLHRVPGVVPLHWRHLAQSPGGLLARARLQPRLHPANLPLLLTSGRIPFPTAVLSTALQRGSPREATVAVEPYAAIGCLMCLSWLLLFHILSLNPHRLETHVERTFFPWGKAAGGVRGRALHPGRHHRPAFFANGGAHKCSRA